MVDIYVSSDDAIITVWDPTYRLGLEVSRMNTVQYSTIHAPYELRVLMHKGLGRIREERVGDPTHQDPVGA